MRDFFWLRLACALWAEFTALYLGAGSVAAQERGWQVYTNRENVRRIAVGGGRVAFATSGGVRLWDKTAKRWREWTMHDGLPSHNVVDVAFEPQAAGGRLWVLTGDWSLSGYPGGGHLYLSPISLPGGSVQTETPSPTPPPGQPTDFSNWAEYRLRLSPATVWVYAQKDKAALQFNRQTKAWETPSTTAPSAPAPRAGAAGVFRGLQNAGQGKLLLDFSRGFFLYDASNRALAPRFYPYPWPLTYAYGGPYPAMVHSPLMNVEVDPKHTGVVTFFAIEQQKNYNAVQGSAVPSWRVNCRAEVVNGKAIVKEVSRRLLSTPELKRLTIPSGKYDAPPDRLRGGILTDIAVEPGPGGAIWFATYNQPGIHATGITRYDRATGIWSYPTQGATGIVANQIVSLFNTAGNSVVVGTTNGSSTYDSATGIWRDGGSQAQGLPGLPQWATRYVSDPEKSGRQLQIVGEEDGGKKLWVRWRETDALYHSGRLDTVAKKRETLTSIRPEFSGLSLTSFRLNGDTIWLAGEDTTQAPLGPVVLRWDRHAGTVTRYHTPQWSGDISKAFHGNVFPGVDFYRAAGTVWVRVLYALFRYDRATDTWQQERASQSVSTLYPFADSLWLPNSGQYLPNLMTPYTLLRWQNDGKGWQRLNVPPELQALSLTVLQRDGGELWMGGLGIVHLWPNQLQFTPVE